MLNLNFVDLEDLFLNSVVSVSHHGLTLHNYSL